jgi:FtsP/CotA-like multicopper oxidase with cupredoxin domain
MKLVGGDNGRVEQQEFVDDVLITPSERAVLDVLFEREGRVTLEDGSGVDGNVLGVVDVSAPHVDQSFASEFETLRACPGLRAERAALGEHMERPPDKTVALVAVMPGVSRDAGQSPEVAWEDRMADPNRLSTPETIIWKLVDPATGAENEAIDWEFRLGDRVKIRIVNEMQSDQPMPHPFHIHGERFLVLSRNGVPNRNLVWKDTVLVNARRDDGHLDGRGQPGHLDGPLPHCRTS